MATYNSIISRTDAAALIPEEASREIMAAIPKRAPLCSWRAACRI